MSKFRKAILAAGAAAVAVLGTALLKGGIGEVEVAAAVSAAIAAGYGVYKVKNTT